MEEKLRKLMLAMIAYNNGDAKRIQHFIKVHALAKLIGEEEKLDAKTLYILEAAALTHDIGIRNSEQKYGTCTGKQQEVEGPPEAEKLLQSLGFDATVTERVCWLIVLSEILETIPYEILTSVSNRVKRVYYQN